MLRRSLGLGSLNLPLKLLSLHLLGNLLNIKRKTIDKNLLLRLKLRPCVLLLVLSVLGQMLVSILIGEIFVSFSNCKKYLTTLVA
jgi:hypothetical protein